MHRFIYTKWIIIVCLVAFTFLFPQMVKDLYWIHLSMTVLLNVGCAIGLWLIVVTGQLSIAQGAFMAVGAYTSAMLTKSAGLPFWPSFFLAGFFALFVALIIGIPTLRIKGAYFAILSFAFGEVIRLFLYAMQSMGGSDGITGIPQTGAIRLPGMDAISLASPKSFYFFALIFMWICVLFAYRMSRVSLGINFRAIADSDMLAESLGIDPMRYKLLAFVVGAVFAGFAGSIMAHYLTYISPDYFSFNTSVNFLLFVLIGGTGSVAGPVVGATFLTVLPEILATTVGQYRLIIYGVLLIVVVIYLPGGLISIPEKILFLLRRRQKQ